MCWTNVKKMRVCKCAIIDFFCMKIIKTFFGSRSWALMTFIAAGKRVGRNEGDPSVAMLTLRSH